MDPAHSHPSTRRASHAELSTLCQSCGLCCDGSLFGRVDLEIEEVDLARRRQLRVIASGRSFEQPCRALRAAPRGPSDRRNCAIYEDRPFSCRRFVCLLYDKYRHEGGSIEKPLSVVRRVRSLLALLDAPPLAVDSARPLVGARNHPVTAARARVELTRILEENFAESRRNQATGTTPT